MPDDAPRAIANVEAEAALLGGMMQANRIIDMVADVLTHEDFSEHHHGVIFTAIVAEASAGRQVTPLSIKPLVEDGADWGPLGGVLHYLATISRDGVVAGAKDLAHQVRDFARRRHLVEAMEQAIERASSQGERLADVIASADAALADVGSSGDGVWQGSLGDCVRSLVDEFEQPKARILSGIDSIDGLLGPIRPGNLIIKAGRPGMGKSAEALCYAYSAAMRGHGVLFASLEMPKDEIGARLVSHHLRGGQVGVPYGAIMKGDLSASQRREVIRAQDAIDDLPFNVIDPGSLTVGRLAMMVGRWKRRMEARGQRLDIVVVDYLQLLRVDHRVTSRYEEVTEVSRTLKSIAKHHGIAMIALSQLSRKVEDRHDKRPMLSDLRESGQIEQDADAVMFLYREEYYLDQARPPEEHPAYPEWSMKMAEAQGQIEFILAKRRQGVTGSASGLFDGATQTVA